jgi:type I restriction enzyme S subunit
MEMGTQKISMNTITLTNDLRGPLINPDWVKLPLFDRSKWQCVRFGDVVDNLNETERNPQGAGIERFIGLEHLEPGSLHICNWGNVADGTTFNRRCRPEQVLFGKRRAYQRKVAVAEFDAVVSGDIYIFAPKNDRLLPELLPFLCMSERFFKFAVETSAGSLSPRTNWSSLSGFEFDLPPLTQQRSIAKILWAVDEVAESQLHLTASIESVLAETKEDHLLKSVTHMACLADAVLDSAYGPRFSNSLYSPDGEIAQLRTTDISNEGEINYATIPRVDLEARTLAPHILEDGDFLISRSGTCGIGAVYRDSGIPTVPGAFLIRLRLNGSLLPDYLCEYINSRSGRKHMNRLAAGGVQKNIRGSTLLTESVPMPPVAEQKRFLEHLHKQRIYENSIKQLLESTNSLLHKIINTVFQV